MYTNELKLTDDGQIIDSHVILTPINDDHSELTADDVLKLAWVNSGEYVLVPFHVWKARQMEVK